MAKKYYGNFTPAAAGKALKSADRFFCQITDDGTIFSGSGHVLFKLTPADYAAVVQPVACCEAGNWTIGKDCKQDSSLNAAQIFNNAVKATENADALQACPLSIVCNKNPGAAYYNAAADFAAIYNPAYIAAFSPGATIRATNDKSPAIVYNGDEAIGLVMPIRCEPKAARAVKAWFSDDNNQQANDNASDNSAEITDLQNQLIARNSELLCARDEIAALRDEINDLQAELAELTADNAEAARTVKDAIEEMKALAAEHAEQIATMQAAASAYNKPEPKTAAELIAARWAQVDGLTATIKGAQTAAPVVWLDGDTKAHAKAIEADGGKWSSKKNVYYFRVA